MSQGSDKGWGADPIEDIVSLWGENALAWLRGEITTSEYLALETEANPSFPAALAEVIKKEVWEDCHAQIS